MSKKNPKVDLYLADGCGRCSLYQTPQCKVHTWQQELTALRQLALDSGLEEDLKWKQPCYTLHGGNVLMVTAFKDYACINFFKGVLLKDPAGLLHRPGENSQAARLLKFTSKKEITGLRSVIKAYIQEAIEVEQAGLRVAFKKQPEPMPEELQTKLDEDPDFNKAFHALTPGRQRAYILFFSAAKQAKTRQARIEKCVPRILSGKGLNDPYTP